MNKMDWAAGCAVCLPCVAAVGAALLTMFLLAMFMVSCGTVPVPKKADDTGISSSQEQAESPAPAPPSSVQVPPPAALQKPSSPPIPTPVLSPAERVQNAITLLQNGNASMAKKELEASLRDEPQNKVAKNLLMQIDADPAQYFAGQASFAYMVQPGDSLSTLAKRFLDDALKFHILAKYNGIENPSHLNPGQMISIPSKKLAVPTPGVKKPEDSKFDDIKLTQAKKNYDVGKYPEAIGLLESATTESLEVRDLLVLSYTKYAEDLANKANLLEAQNILEKAVTIQPGNQKLKKQLLQVENRRAAAALYEVGAHALDAGDGTKAMEAFYQVLQLDPNHMMAKKQMAHLKPDELENIHKEAMAQYRKQNLNEAIELWDKLLILDPTHELAKMYRARSLELKERLENIGKK